MNILISGDFFIADEYANKELIDQSVVDLFKQADYRIINLEAPLTANESTNKILKTGPNLRMSEVTVMPYFKQLKVDAVTLANNHILDNATKGNVGYIDNFMSVYRINATGSWSSSFINNERKRKKHLLAIAKMYDNFDLWTNKKWHNIILRKKLLIDGII